MVSESESWLEDVGTLVQAKFKSRSNVLYNHNKKRDKNSIFNTKASTLDHMRENETKHLPQSRKVTVKYQNNACFIELVLHSTQVEFSNGKRSSHFRLKSNRATQVLSGILARQTIYTRSGY
ncbi:hypothetical protein PoB_004591900 [Plakobranchus ocellatus]|uniref:Uncharacterized protein n=1 Tax=Plakobranchus ocellatus TaxID=259542 RepID=A0AAV4BH49_9GAST|nr:hypothetical protein PoB_004591900 [Plakobranchus ocellatus]